jgi:lipoprotein-releasing system permease protein
MPFELLVALRYLKAKRKHAAISVITLVSIAGVAAGVAALVVALAINAGFRTDLRDKLLGTTQAHVTLLPLGEGISDYLNVVAAVEKIDGVVAAAPAVYSKVLISGNSRQDGVFVKGILAEREFRVSDLAKTLKMGSASGFNDPVDTDRLPPILIGTKLSEMLGGLVVGDPVKLLTFNFNTGPFGPQLRPMSFEVAGIFDSGLYEHDMGWVYAPLDATQRLLKIEETEKGPLAMAIEIKIRDIDNARDIGKRITGEVSAATGQKFDHTDWIEQNTKIFNALELERLVMFITIGLIVMVAALNIVSSLTMMVLEKARDIAILMAMGATRQTIRRIFIWQGVIIGVVGTIIGLILGHGISFVADHYRLVSLDAEVYSIEYVPFRPNPLDSIVIAAVAIAISFLATLYPSTEAARLEPVETLRYE